MLNLIPWIIGIGNLVSAVMVGKGKASGWVVMLLAQALFVVYGLATNQQGFILQLGMIGIAGMNLYKWKQLNQLEVTN